MGVRQFFTALCGKALKKFHRSRESCSEYYDTISLPAMLNFHFHIKLSKMKKLSKVAQKAIKGGESQAECLDRCREVLEGCGPGRLPRSFCPEYTACRRSCIRPYF